MLSENRTMAKIQAHLDSTADCLPDELSLPVWEALRASEACRSGIALSVSLPESLTVAD